ncbi:MAG: AAA family ATPase [Gammaproteobacteria bacterium]|nr:AAA family ATPase [Gammaproteobacteria bacterium]
MITSLQLKSFKNFADERLPVGAFTVIVGANASGKSNIRDAFRFLHGIGRGYRFADIVGGKYGAGGQAEWEKIRGAADEIVRLGDSTFGMSMTMDLRERGSNTAFGNDSGPQSGQTKAHYEIEVSNHHVSGGYEVVKETLKERYDNVYTSHPPFGDPVQDQDDDTHLLLRMGKTRQQRKFGDRIAVRQDQPALTQIQEHKRVVQRQKALARHVIAVLNSMRFLDLSPVNLRQPAFPGQTVLGDSGQNLPTVLKEICEDEGRRRNLVEWTRELTPMDVDEFEFPEDPTSGHIQLALREKIGKTISAYSASDGTLRFLAMLAALLGKNPAGLYVFEEIDNGIHPSRLRLLLELIENRTAKGDIQVVTTTHSPELLSMISDETFKSTSVICRNPDTDDAVIRPIAELPNARELRKSQGLGRLHTGGWLENAVWFDQSGTDTG